MAALSCWRWRLHPLHCACGGEAAADVMLECEVGAEAEGDADGEAVEWEWVQ